MLISLFKTSFDHFQFRPTSGMTSIHDLTVCHKFNGVQIWNILSSIELLPPANSFAAWNILRNMKGRQFKMIDSSTKSASRVIIFCLFDQNDKLTVAFLQFHLKSYISFAKLKLCNNKIFTISDILCWIVEGGLQPPIDKLIHRHHCNAL